MKRTIVVLVALLAGCATGKAISPADSSYQKIVKLPGQPKEAIFEKSRQWIASSFNSGKEVLQYQSLAEGVIIGNGSMPRPRSTHNVLGEGVITYSMREEVKDGAARITFERFDAIMPPSYGWQSSVVADDLPEMKATFEGMLADLQAYILDVQGDKW